MYQWHVRIRGRVMGPFSIQQLLEMKDRGQLQSFHEVSTSPPNWKMAGTVPEIFPRDAIIADPPQVPPPSPPLPLHSPRKRGPSAAVVLIAGGAVGLLVALLIVVIAVVVWSRGGLKGLATSGTKDDAVRFDKNTSDQEKDQRLADVIGLVVCGDEITYADGSRKESARSTGSCFAVTRDGFLITNQHVVKATEESKRSSRRQELEATLKITIRPKIWVFFGRADKYEAEIRHVSGDFDMAILKIERKTQTYLAPSNADPDSFARGSPVIACGFPGVDRVATTFSEQVVRDLVSLRTRGVVENQFPDKAFDFSIRKGIINVRPLLFRYPEWQRDAQCLQHDAHIFGGNSGGPLISEDGSVIGINTIGRIDSKEALKTNYSVTMPQMRTEIDRQIPNVIWR